MLKNDPLVEFNKKMINIYLEFCELYGNILSNYASTEREMFNFENSANTAFIAF